ncbi:MAG TPA: hypothetical protein VNX66_17080 [Candidatus Sulfotelmatobacter sp.]|jgi:hypothetical protein|nr:hypothetical protein [Candidatus Sulfotelmatobacter sp.]
MKRPLPVTILGCLFIAAGLVGLVYHFQERPLEPGIVLVSLVRLLAVIGGVFLLLGHGWARWLLIAWLAFHVGVSAFHSLSETLAHLALLVVVGYFLLRPPASNYFRSSHTT